MSEFVWIQEIDRSSHFIGYYTREPDGLSGMTPAALAQLVSIPPSDIEAIVSKVLSSTDPKSDLPIPLRIFAGQLDVVATFESPLSLPIGKN